MMQTRYHIEITRKALQNHFSESALGTIITANIRQDRLKYQIGHDQLHFDGSAFSKGFQYITEQEENIITQMAQEDYKNAREAFGRILHSWQDFFSHSNYIKLWIDEHPQLTPEEIEINDPDIFYHTDLKSGINYGLIELFAMFPLISGWVKTWMPPDSHARMNLDSPSSGPEFEFAYWAALKASVTAFEQLTQHMNSLDNNERMSMLFRDKQFEK
jgi:hypothetical protein